MPKRFLTAADVAEMLQVKPAWVREHAAELGGMRLGDGPVGRLRFDEERVIEAMERRRIEGPPAQRARRRPGPRQMPLDDVELLPLPKWADGGGR